MPPVADPQSDLALRIDQLAAQLRSTVAHADEVLAAILPVQARGELCAITVWTVGADQRFELRRVADGQRIADETALRDALTLAAVVETLTEPLGPARLRTVATGLVDWRDSGGRDGVAADDPTWPPLCDALGMALDALAQLELAVTSDPVCVASTDRLEGVSTRLIDLDAAWVRLESAAEAFSDARLTTGATDAATDAAAAAPDELVISLWSALGAARRGPLAQPAAALVESGRRAGAAFATDVLGPQLR